VQLVSPPVPLASNQGEMPLPASTRRRLAVAIVLLSGAALLLWLGARALAAEARTWQPQLKEKAASAAINAQVMKE
jgi:threonine/homoserine/homoserine lactone efflux protein